MKNTHIFTYIFLTFIILISSDALSQDNFKWGKKEKLARGHWMNTTRLVNEGDYLEAYEPISWLLNNAPELSESLYKVAPKAYLAKLDETKDAKKAKGLQDTILFVYDEYIRLYGNKASILNKKGKVAFPYLYESPANHDKLFNLYKEIYTLNSDKTYLQNILYYFTVSGYRLKSNKMTDTEYLALYESLNADLEERKEAASGKKANIVSKYQSYIDDELNRNITLDCDFAQNTYGPKYLAEPSVKMANKIQSLMEKNKCVNNDLYIQVTEYLVTEEGENFKNLKTLANIYHAQQKDEDAYQYLTKALPLAPDEEKAAETYFLMAKIDRSNGKYSSARSNIMNAIDKDPSLSTEGHELIGDMYMATASSQSGDDEVKNRAGYIAAYNEYKRAGASAKMASAKSQFPSMKELFVRSYKVGDQLNTGTWINQTIILEKRD